MSAKDYSTVTTSLRMERRESSSHEHHALDHVNTEPLDESSDSPLLIYSRGSLPAVHRYTMARSSTLSCRKMAEVYAPSCQELVLRERIVQTIVGVGV